MHYIMHDITQCIQPVQEDVWAALGRDDMRLRAAHVTAWRIAPLLSKPAAVVRYVTRYVMRNAELLCTMFCTI